jgi:hypothetical protein
MAKANLICKRCHRLRAVNRVMYCEDCDKVLRGDERPQERRKRFKLVEKLTEPTPLSPDGISKGKEAELVAVVAAVAPATAAALDTPFTLPNV